MIAGIELDLSPAGAARERVIEGPDGLVKSVELIRHIQKPRGLVARGDVKHRTGQRTSVAWEPFVDRGDVEGGEVAEGELVVAGSDGAVALEPADAAFHSVALLVQFRVERGRAAPAAAPLLAVAGLVGLLRDGATDPAPPQVHAVGAGTVRLVRQHPVPPGAGPTPLGTGCTRIPSTTAWNSGLSPRCPAVTRIDSGFCSCSPAKCVLAVR